mmetsp:Transcript_17423/g.40216  ORF Transcript_17423/g.40216 Transcript_17423/m.40216 type:complete len:217 (+) Transcript_17423:55-705(+)
MQRVAEDHADELQPAGGTGGEGEREDGVRQRPFSEGERTPSSPSLCSDLESPEPRRHSLPAKLASSLSRSPSSSSGGDGGVQQQHKASPVFMGGVGVQPESPFEALKELVLHASPIRSDPKPKKASEVGRKPDEGLNRIWPADWWKGDAEEEKGEKPVLAKLKPSGPPKTLCRDLPRRDIRPVRMWESANAIRMRQTIEAEVTSDAASPTPSPRIR